MGFELRVIVELEYALNGIELKLDDVSDEPTWVIRPDLSVKLANDAISSSIQKFHCILF